MEDEVKRVAQRIRRWREHDGFTLQELARRSGVASSTIHKIESLQMVPTIAVVLKIARGLGRRSSELVHDGTDGLPVVHQKPEERIPIEVEGVVRAYRLVGDLIDPTLEAWRVSHSPGTGIGAQDIHFDGEILLLGERGRLDVTIDDTLYVIEPGDSLHFKASLAHGWKNNGESTAAFIVVGTLSQAMRSILGDRLSRRDVPVELEVDQVGGSS